MQPGSDSAFWLTRRPTRTNCGCANTPTRGPLSTTNLLDPKNGNVCWRGERDTKALLEEPQAASATGAETCRTTLLPKASAALNMCFNASFKRKRGGAVLPATPRRKLPEGNAYFPTTTMTNESGFILPRRSPGAGGSKSAAGMKILCVFKSRPMVRALGLVGTFSTTVYLSGES